MGNRAFNIGTSCLTCRRRKVKCDRSKPVCLACIKYKSISECSYEVKRGVKFLYMVYSASSASENAGNKVSKSRTRKLNENKSTALPISTFEKLDQSVEQVRESPFDYGILSKFGQMSFYDDYEAVEINAGRLSFVGPLHFTAISRRDPFLYVIMTMIHKERSELHKKALRSASAVRQKYPLPRYTQDEIASQLIIARKAPKKETPLSRRAGFKVKSRYNKPIRAECTDQGLQDDPKAGLNDTATQQSAPNTSSDSKFKRRLIENEQLEEVESVVQEEQMARNPLSVINLLNEEKTAKGSLGITSNQVSDQNKDIEIWRKLQAMLATLQQQQRGPLSEVNSQSHSVAPSPEMKVFSKIQKMIPTRKVIWLHLRNYFHSPLHALFPVLTEDWFNDDMREILRGSEENDSQPEIVISGKFDFARLGSLLIVLRLSFLMYSDTKGTQDTEELQEVLSQSIGPEFVDTAQQCMHLFKLLRKALLPVLHCTILLRIYRRYAPEEGDIVDGGDSEAFSGLITKMATSIGLHTETEFSKHLTFSKMYRQAWRKCWYVVYFLDLYEGMNTGNALMIHKHSFSTKLPTFELDSDGTVPSYITQFDLERSSIDCIKKNYELSNLCRKLLKMVMNKKLKTSCESIHLCAGELNTALRANFGKTLDDIMRRPCETISDSVIKCNDFKMFIEVSSLLAMVHFHTYLHIDKLVGSDSSRYDPLASFEYLKKLLLLYIEIEPVLNLLDASNNNTADRPDIFVTMFGFNSKLLILQCCGMFIIRFTTILQCLTSRLQHYKLNYLQPQCGVKGSWQTNQHDVAKVVDALIENLLGRLSYMNDITQSLSETHFYAWRMSKGNAYVLELLRNEESIFDRNLNAGTQHHDDEYIKTAKKVDPMAELNLYDVIPEGNSLALADISILESMLSILNGSQESEASTSSGENCADQVKQVPCSESPSMATLSDGNNLLRTSGKSGPSQSPAFCKALKHESQSPPPQSVKDSSYSSKILGEQSQHELESYASSDNIDTFWYRTKMRGDNLRTEISYSKSQDILDPGSSLVDDLSRPQGVSINNEDRTVALDEGTHDSSRSHTYSEEVFNNQTLLQEHVLQQLEELTNGYHSQQVSEAERINAKCRAPFFSLDLNDGIERNLGGNNNERSLDHTGLDVFFPTFDSFIDGFNFY